MNLLVKMCFLRYHGKKQKQEGKKWDFRKQI